MTAQQLITYGIDIVFFAVFLVTLAEAVRHPRPVHRDIALFFGALAVALGEGLVTDITGEPPRVIAAATSVFVVALPYLLLRLVDDFAGVPRPLLRLAELGLAISAVTLFVVSLPYPGEYTLALVGYFVVVQGYVSWRFVESARASTGVTQRRMQAVALGSGLLALAVFIAGLGIVLPRPGLWSSAASATALASGLSYFVGFAPPQVLRRGWRAPQLQDFLATIASTPATMNLIDLEVAVEEAAARTVGAPRAMIALWDGPGQRLLAPRLGDDPSLPARARPTVATRAFETQRVFFEPDAPKSDPENADIYRQFGATAVLIAPISAGRTRFGVLSVFGPRAPIFAEDDLALVEVLAAQIAALLQRRELSNEVARSLAREEATALRDDFLVAITHDLRTPLTTLLGNAQRLIRKHYAEPEQPADVDSIQAIADESRRMAALINELLDASRAGEPGFVGERESADLGELAKEAVRHHSSRRHDFILDAAPVVGMVDGRRIIQLLDNLIGNAIKYSPQGGDVRIEVTNDDGAAHITVRDEGIGIPAEDCERIFERFQRGSGAAHNMSGAGLGLYICKAIAVGHGGNIWVESEVGQGTTMHVSLPLTPPKPDAAKPDDEASRVPDEVIPRVDEAPPIHPSV